MIISSWFTYRICVSYFVCSFHFSRRSVPLQGHRIGSLTGPILIVYLSVTVRGFSCIDPRGVSKNIALGRTRYVLIAFSLGRSCTQKCFRESFCETGEVSGFPEKEADLRGSSGNFPGKSGELPGKSGKLPGKSGKLPGKPLILLLSSTVRELAGGTRRGTSGEVRGTSGEVRGRSRNSGEPDSLPATRQICLQVLLHHGCWVYAPQPRS